MRVFVPLMRCVMAGMDATPVSSRHVVKTNCTVRALVGTLSWLPPLLLSATVGCYSSSTGDASSAQSSARQSSSRSAAKPISCSIRFRDVTAECGVSWTIRNGEEAGLFGLIESFGSGCAIDDFDRDGLPDLFFAGGGRFGSTDQILPLPIAVFRQTSAWKFEDVTKHACFESIRHYNHGMWMADYDEDGYCDLLITGWHGLQLLQNQGDGTFVDRTDTSGMDDAEWSLAAAWADLNGDQLLDLFVGHYSNWSLSNNPVCFDLKYGNRTICAPTQFRGAACEVFLNNGDGTFSAAGKEIGIHEVGKTLGVVVADINDDNRPDVYVANDTLPNQLYEIQSDGKYRDVAIQNAVALGDTGLADGSMGVDMGDVDGDGKPDIWVANFENQSFALYRNLGNDIFSHESRKFGVMSVGTQAVGFGTVIADFDGDGNEDIFCSNGDVRSMTSPIDRRQLPYLFWNEVGKRLHNVAAQVGHYMGERHLGRGVAAGDLDGNGTVDLVVTHTNEPIAILRNESTIPRWLTVRLIGRASPRSAIGAKVTVSCGSKKWTKLVKGGGSYLSTSDRALFFGLANSESVDLIEIFWPAGGKSTIEGVELSRAVTVVEPADAGFGSVN